MPHFDPRVQRHSGLMTVKTKGELSLSLFLSLSPSLSDVLVYLFSCYISAPFSYFSLQTNSLLASQHTKPQNVQPPPKCLPWLPSFQNLAGTAPTVQ